MRKAQSDYSKMSDEQIISAMATVMADSIGRLIHVCVERRCMQFLELIHKEGYFAPPNHTEQTGKE